MCQLIFIFIQHYEHCFYYFFKEWGAEGYELWCVQEHEGGKEACWGKSSFVDTEDKKEEKEEEEVTTGTSVLQFSFIKSALTVNPCMVRS